MNYGLVIHGGAGTILQSKLSTELEQEYHSLLGAILQEGHTSLSKSKSALDVVKQAVRRMEDSPLFNAGKGAVFTHEKKNEMDATIIDGSTGGCGAVAMVTNIRNPISLARAVMERTSHILLGGEGAKKFAEEIGHTIEQDDYFYTDRRWLQLQAALENENGTAILDHNGKHGTVGAVALDMNGHLAAATSSGGMTNKRYNRIGDSSLIGCGTYANTSCAVSTTGIGEEFMRNVSAYDLSALMMYKNMSLQESADEVVRKLGNGKENIGGLIAIDDNGNIAMPFNTTGMYRGYYISNKQPAVLIYKD